MAVVKGHVQRHSFQQTALQNGFLPDVRTVPGEDDIVLHTGHAGGQQVGVVAVAGDEDIGVFPAEFPQQAGQAALFVTLGVADAQRAAEAGGRLLRARHGDVHVVEDGLGLPQKDGSARRQGNGAGAAVDELDADGFLQRADLLGDGGLGNEKIRRRFGEAFRFGDGDKVSQLVGVHAVHPSDNIT